MVRKLNKFFTIIFIYWLICISTYNYCENKEKEKYIKFDIGCECTIYEMANSVYFKFGLNERIYVYMLHSEIYNNKYIKISNEYYYLILNNILNLYIETKIIIVDSTKECMNGFFKGEKELEVVFINDSAEVNFEWKFEELKPADVID